MGGGGNKRNARRWEYHYTNSKHLSPVKSHLMNIINFTRVPVVVQNGLGARASIGGTEVKTEEDDRSCG